jgi:hypothetical protein
MQLGTQISVHRPLRIVLRRIYGIDESSGDWEQITAYYHYKEDQYIQMERHLERMEDKRQARMFPPTKLMEGKRQTVWEKILKNWGITNWREKTGKE